ncbi:MAG TPA: hypothetical protein VF530_01845 [Planctomycetota bacterium]
MRTLRTPDRTDCGSVLVLSLLLLVALGGLTTTLALYNLRLQAEHERARDDLRAFCVAEAGLNEAHAVLLAEGFAGARALAYPRATSSGSYAVELLDGRDDDSIDLDRVRLRSVGTAGRDPVGVQLMLYHVPTGKFRFAIFGAEGVRLNSNVVVDSYDPADGPYPDKVEFVNDFGNVGSFDMIEIHANVSVYGDALVSETGVFDDGAPMVKVTGDQQAGELEEEMPAITVPVLTSKGNLSVTSGATIPAGLHRYDSLAVTGGTLRIQGPATVVVDNFTMTSKTALQIDTTGGPVTFYATGNVKLDSNSRIRTNNQSARDFELLITSDNRKGGKTVDLSSNAEFVGTIYAPNARLRLPSNFRVFGAVKAAQVELASNGKIHFDEGLLYDPLAADLFEVVSWRRLSRAEGDAVLAAGGSLP